jgi:hypothetical protein
MGIWHIPFSETLHMLNDMMSFIFTLGSARHLKCSNWVKITSCHSWIIHVDPVSCMRKSCNFHAVRSDPKMTGCSLTFMPKSQGFSRIYHAFLLTPLDSHWSVKSIADDAPKKKCDHGCMVCYVTCWCSWYFFGLINSEHLEPFPCEPSNDAQGMEAWSTSFESTLWKGLGNEHCAKVPVKRELRSSGYRKVGVEA